MELSGLFKEHRVSQSQGVAYLHSWVDPTKDEGSFYFYPNGTEGPATAIPPTFNTAIVLDGSVIVHGVDIFRPWQRPPKIVASDKNELVYLGQERWEVRANGVKVADYKTTDLRISLVWRQRCFEREADVQRWADMKDFMSVHEVLGHFVEDMRKRGILREGEATPEGMDLALKIMSNYIVYPVDETKGWVPFNYCMVPRILPKALQAAAT
jgi:hypothetical protein